jgi:hypothetical protein
MNFNSGFNNNSCCILTLELYKNFLLKGTVCMVRLELPDSVIVEYALVNPQ